MAERWSATVFEQFRMDPFVLSEMKDTGKILYVDGDENFAYTSFRKYLKDVGIVGGIEIRPITDINFDNGDGYAPLNSVFKKQAIQAATH